MLEVAVQHERAGRDGHASILLVSPDAERKLPEVRAALAACDGASAFPDGAKRVTVHYPIR